MNSYLATFIDNDDGDGDGDGLVKSGLEEQDWHRAKYERSFQSE